jgi:hypothetical protein
MEHLRATATLEVPAAQAEGVMLAYFESRRNADGQIEIPLRVPLDDFGLPGDLSLERNVIASVEKRRDAENLNDEFGIEWGPSQGHVYPTFHGRIIACAQVGEEPPYLELDGTYEPPLGATGEAFDATIGHLIAQRTAQAFIADVADGVAALAKSHAQ